MTLRPPASRRARRALAVAALALSAMSIGVASPAAGAAPTVVTLEFDDTWANQYGVRQLLADRGMHATFYVNSGFFEKQGRMTASEVAGLAADGNEIGGHSIDHPDLTKLSLDEARHEICDDRVALLGRGLAVANFAYPYAHSNAAVRQLAIDCGYNSARTTAGIVKGSICSACPAAETIPPFDPYATRTPDIVRSTDTPASLEALVTQAEDAGGGWVQIVFHQVCATCSPYGQPESAIAELLDRLAAHAASGTVVRTVGEVIGGTVKPGVETPAARPGNLFGNPSLENDVDTNGVADCWQRAGYGTSTFSWARVEGRTGGAAEQLTVNTISSGDRKLISPLDSGSCAPRATPGREYRVGGWYRSTAPVRFVLYTRDAAGTWSFWNKSGYLPASAGWAEAAWVTPPVPPGATALSAGLALDAVGTAAFDDFTLAVNLLRNSSLDADANTDGVADCWQRAGYGTNTFSWSRVVGRGVGSAEQLTIASLASGDRKLISPLDGGGCAPATTPARVYDVSGWYRSGAPVRFVTYTRDAAGTWTFWAQSPFFPASTGWSQATWTTPPVRAGATGISAGLALNATGSATFDDLCLFDAG